MPLPPLFPKIDFKNLATFMAGFEDMPRISGGIASYGSPAAYALVWEFGSDRAEYPGPKTMWSENPLGELSIMSKQAPHGYIRIHADDYWPIIKEELSHVSFRDVRTARDLELRFQVAVDNASQRMAKLISESAPVDSGDLRASIQYVDSGDEAQFIDIGDTSSAEGYGTFVF